MNNDNTYLSRWDRRKEVITTNTKFNAWLLDFGNDFKAAVAYNEMTHILLEPVIYYIPCTPVYCSHLLYTDEGDIQPIADIAALMNGKSSLVADTSKFTIGQVIYQHSPTTPVYRAALYLSIPPESISVSDEQACELKINNPHWKNISCSCIKHENRLIPILNLSHLFSSEFSQSLKQNSHLI